MAEKEKKNPEVNLDVKLDDETAQGRYVNLGVVNYNESEFVIDLLFVQPQSPRADVRSRVILSPKNARRLVVTLQESLNRYEQAFGKVDQPAAPVAPTVPADEPSGDYH